jgi:hypothetical protein
LTEFIGYLSDPEFARHEPYCIFIQSFDKVIGFVAIARGISVQLVLAYRERISMAKASIQLPNGTVVTIDGTTEEVASLLATYGQAPPPDKPGATKTKTPGARRNRARRNANGNAESAKKVSAGLTSLQLTEVVNAVKSCTEADAIEKKILDKTSQVDRTLLPLYAVHEFLESKYALSSGEISKITTQLGIPISIANASTTLSGTASRYVMSDSVRQKGVASRYKLSRRGQQYLKAVITGQSHEVKE